MTRDTVDLFLELDNPLESITIERNKRPPLNDPLHNDSEPAVRNDDPIWKERIARDNLNIRIYYCECEL